MRKINLYITILAFVFYGCNHEKEQQSVVKNIEKGFNKNVITNTTIKNQLFYKENTIKMKAIDEEHFYAVQEIEQQRGDIKYRAIRVSTEAYLKRKGLTIDEMELALEELEGEQLFYIEFEETQKQDLMKKYFNNAMDQSVAYLSFKINKDFKIINAINDTIESNYSIYERNYHVAPFERLLLSFKGISNTEEVELIYTDNFFNKGQMNFYFPTQDYILKNTPIVL